MTQPNAPEDYSGQTLYAGSNEASVGVKVEKKYKRSQLKDDNFKTEKTRGDVVFKTILR